jgi:hypothetical protein
MKRKTSIIIETTTRDLLKSIGRKNQTYDELLKELSKLKNIRDLPDHQFPGYNQANP